MTKMGPNDMRCIVWALGEFYCFFFFVCFVLLYINRCFIVFVGCIYNLGKRETVRG